MRRVRQAVNRVARSIANRRLRRERIAQRTAASGTGSSGSSGG